MSEEYKSIVDAVGRYAGLWPDKTAIADQYGAYSYGQLYSQALTLAASLCAQGVGRGSTVVVECTQDCRFILLDMACELAGGVFVPFEAGAQSDKIREICEATEAEIVISDRKDLPDGSWLCLPTLSEPPEGYEFIPCEVNGEEVAEILFSTGTTGKPKGIVLSHRANVAVAENILYGAHMTKDTVELVPLPLSHSHGLRTCYAHLVNGSTVVIAKGVLNTGVIFDLMDVYGVTAFDFAPTMARLLLQIGRQGLEQRKSQIEYIELGTAALDEDTKGQLKELFEGAHIYNFYGSTEAGRCCVLDVSRENLAGCVGYPARHAAIMVTDENRQVIDSSRDTPGLLAVKGRMMMEGYLNSPELTAETLSDGILYTSDIGYIDEKGRIYVLGRANDVINFNGIKIAPDEIESVARTYEGVKDCACVGVADKICGQRPKLYVELSIDTIDMKQFKEFMKQNLGPARTPLVEVIDELPRSLNGKILRSELRR